MTQSKTIALLLAAAFLGPLTAAAAGLAEPVSTLVAPGSDLSAIAVDSGRLFLGCSNQVRRVDRANPLRPLPPITCPGPVRQIVPAGDWTWVVCDGVGLLAVAADRPPGSAPPLAFPGSSHAQRLVLANGRAMIACGRDGLLTYSVTNPAAPVLLSVFRGAIDARDVSLIASVAVVADGVFGLKFVDFSEPEHPVLVGVGLDAHLGAILALATTGTRVVASDGRHLCLFDASNPARAVRLAAYEAPAAVRDLALAGDWVFLACGPRGVVILDWAADFAEVGRFHPPGDALALAVSRSTRFVATGMGQWVSW